MRWAARKGAPEGSWLASMIARKPAMLVRVALANKMARVMWALMAKGGIRDQDVRPRSQRLAPLRYRHPRFSFEIHPTNGIEDILRGDANIAWRVTRPRQKNLIAQRIASIEIGLFASKSLVDSLPHVERCDVPSQTATISQFAPRVKQSPDKSNATTPTSLVCCNFG